MRPSPRSLAMVAALAGGFLMAAPAAHAVIDPAKMSMIESLQKTDPVVMANCATGTIADPAGAVVIPPEVPLVGCLTL
ncbi:hypothetical protein ABZW11_24180 [Nonomuraea sp. NPDC004580]|uniref:hypothetical protein n=1 Tax=Nonomuraea sp. NPDC004580 TaxID=3154552 RepID=UPI0033B630C7